MVIGGLEAVIFLPLNLGGVQTTQHSVAPLMIVNGPYAKEIGLTSGKGCFGPGFRANATIGSAIRLMVPNLGGGIPRVASMSTFGQPSRFTFFVAENEEKSRWESLAVSRGFSPENNVITIVMCAPF